MRRHRWLKLIAGLFTLLSVAGSAQAQGMYPPPGPGGPGAGPGMPNYGFDPAAMFQAGAGNGSAPYPSYFQPWPTVSPFMGADSSSPYLGPTASQISNSDGLWQYSELGGANYSPEYRVRLSYLKAKTETYRDVFGDGRVPEYKQQILPQLLGATGGQGGGGAGGMQTTGIADIIQDPTRDFNLFNPVAGENIEKPEPQGFRLSVEQIGAGGTGWELWGMYTYDNRTEFDARDNVSRSRGQQPDLVVRAVQDADFFASTNPVGPFDDPFQALEANLLNLNGIPLDDGSVENIGSGIIQGGANAVYDLDFRIKHHVEHWGTGLRFMGLPIDTRLVTFRPTGGLRYMNIREDFNFFGRDSGLLYSSSQGGGGGGGGGMNTVQPDVKFHSIPNFADDDGDGIIDNAGVDEGGGAGMQGGGGGGGAQQGATFSNLNDPNIYPISSFLDNEVISHLAGPEIGMNYELVGKGSFRLGGFTQFGLVANHHNIRMDGNNIFVTTRESNLIPPDELNAAPNRFSNQDSHTSISPVIEQQFFMEGPVFQYVPVLRRWPVFSKADFRIAWTYTWIGELTRAGDSIIWQGNPSQDLFPEIETSRSTWRAETWDFGITWRF